MQNFKLIMITLWIIWLLFVIIILVLKPNLKSNYKEKYFKLLEDYYLLGIEFNRSEDLIKVLRRLCDEKDHKLNKLKNP